MRLEEIVKALEENNEEVRNGGHPFTVAQLRDFTRQLSVSTPDTAGLTLLYSGGLQPDGKGSMVSLDDKGLFSFQVANKMADANPNIGIVDNTSSMKLLKHEEFYTALVNTSESGILTRQQIVFGSSTNGIRNPDGLVDDISKRFIAENTGKPVVMLTPFARADSVYAQSELPHILNQKGGEVESLPRSIFQDIHNSNTFGPEGSRLAIAALSAEQAANLKYSYDEKGNLLGVDASEFWREKMSAPDSNIKLEGNIIVAQSELMENLTVTQKSELAKGAQILDEVLPDKPDLSFLRNLGKNGGLITGPAISGLVATFALATGSSEAEAAEIFYEGAVPYGETQIDLYEGDSESAERSATIETVSNGASFGGAMAGAAIGTMILPGIGTVIGAAAFGIASGITSGYLTGLVYDNYETIKQYHTQVNDEVAAFFGETIGDTKTMLASWFDDELDISTALEKLPSAVTPDMPPEVAALIEVKSSTELFEKQFDELEETGSLSEVSKYLDKMQDTPAPQISAPQDTNQQSTYETALAFK